MKPRLPTRLLAIALPIALLVAPAPAPAAPHAVARQGAGDSLRVFLITLGQGAQVWERFGHNAIWVHDPEAGTDIAYHWGLFDMSEEGFMVEFLQGRMVYSMGAADANRLVSAYRGAGRDATIQELAFTVDQAAGLQELLEWNVRPENRRYRYDYFRDNCSTRARDALDDALGGTLVRVLDAWPAEHTYRSQAVTLTAEDRLLTTGMDLGLGPLADRPISHWELAFIPMRLRDDLRDVRVTRGDRSVPLVVSERRLEALDGDASVAAPGIASRRALTHWVTGLLAGGLVALLGLLAVRAGTGGTAGRWALGAVGGVWGLVGGVLGLIVTGLWLLTDHEFAWHNENVLQTNPLALGLAVLAPAAIIAGRWTRAALTLAVALLGLSVLGLLIHPLPITAQANLPIIGLTLPIHAGFAWALYRVHVARRVRVPEDGSGV